jgi:putative membrane protein
MVVMEDTKANEKGWARIRLFYRQFNWRMLLVRILINGLSLLVTAALLPDIYFADPSLLNLFLLAVILGVLNALVKPVLQFLTLTFIFATYGIVIVLINTAILILLSLLFRNLFVVDRLLWAFVGGAVMGILSGLLESLFGLNLPIDVDEVPRREDTELSALPTTGAQQRVTGVPGEESALLEEDRHRNSVAILEATDAALARVPGEPGVQMADEALPVPGEHPDPESAGDGEGGEPS